MRSRNTRRLWFGFLSTSSSHASTGTDVPRQNCSMTCRGEQDKSRITGRGLLMARGPASASRWTVLRCCTPVEARTVLRQPGTAPAGAPPRSGRTGSEARGQTRYPNLGAGVPAPTTTIGQHTTVVLVVGSPNSCGCVQGHLMARYSGEVVSPKLRRYSTASSFSPTAHIPVRAARL